MLYLFIFLVGLAIGSFLNCLIYRLPQRKNILGRSFCPHCQHQLSAWDLIPIFSFLFLKGRCRYCRAKISIQYPLVELTTGFLFFFSYLRLSNYFLNFDFQFPISNFQFPILLFRDWLLVSVFVFIFVYDLKYMLIEDMIVLPVALIVFLLNFLAYRSFYLFFFAGLIGLSFFLLQYLLTNKKGVGEGDLRLGLLMGVAFGWPQILIALTSSYLIGGLAALILLLSGKKKLTSKIPLGPFLAVGSLLSLFFGDKILSLFFPF